jgi:hypothetical protein
MDGTVEALMSFDPRTMSITPLTAARLCCLVARIFDQQASCTSAIELHGKPLYEPYPQSELPEIVREMAVGRDRQSANRQTDARAD